MPAAYLASVWFGKSPADRRLVWLVQRLSSLGLVRREGGQKVLEWHFCGFCSLPHPTCLLFQEDGFRSRTKRKPGSGNFLSLGPPRSAIWRPLLLLINDLPAVYTNFMAFMYAHALHFSPFPQTKPNTTSVKYEFKSLVSAFSRSRLSGDGPISRNHECSPWFCFAGRSFREGRSRLPVWG